MTAPLRLLLATFALGTTALVRAETTPVPAPPIPARVLSPILAALDTDRDGTLSAAEIAAAPEMLTTLDVNEDGMLSPDELRATALAGQRVRGFLGSPSAFNVVLTLDANADGDIQPMEIANAVSSLKRLDANGDGQLTRDELRPAFLQRNSTI